MTRVDRASRLVRRAPAAVFAAMVDPQALLRWLPPEGMSGRFEHADIRPGGSYRLVLTYADASGRGKASEDSDVADVRFVEIVPVERIVQTVDFPSEDAGYAGTMTMTWELRPAPDGTLVELRAEHVPPGISAADHAVGMASSLANLAGYVESRTGR
ncbi:MAG: ATPase [Micrococcales bacterium 73-13]|nr:MAG: ATPase [Micrococcales bacterium 73-13]